MGTVVAPAAERRELGTVADRELVAAARAGDDRAFERLYERYHRRIAAYVYGMVSDYGRAEDITQDVFISALRRMRQTERPIAFKPWIYEIAKNACIDQFRRTRRAEEISFDAEDGAGALESARLTAAGSGPHDAVDAKLQLDHLCGAFGGLSDTHHQILVMRELEGLSYAEIGERLGLSRPSVESTLFRARRRLTEEYDELASGARCARVQDIILNASTKVGARDQRRLLRHVAHCQPCRREARLAGLELGSLPRHPVRDAVAAKVAGILPFPFLLRGRRGGGSATQADPGFVANLSGQLTTMGEPLTAFSKAAAAAAVIAVAGAGAAGVSTLGQAPEPGVASEAERTAERTAPARDRAAKGKARSASPKAVLRGDARRAEGPRRTTSTATAGSGTGAAAPAVSGGGPQSPSAPSTAPAATLPASTDIGSGPTPDRPWLPQPDGEPDLPRVALPTSDAVAGELTEAVDGLEQGAGTLTEDVAGALAGGD